MAATLQQKMQTKSQIIATLGKKQPLILWKMLSLQNGKMWEMAATKSKIKYCIPKTSFKKIIQRALFEIVGKSVAKSVVKSVAQIVGETVTKQMCQAITMSRL